MKYLEHREQRTHGTLDFPFAYYLVSPVHPRYNMVCHWHSEHELMRVVTGSLHLTLDDRKFVARPGDIFFIPGGMLHGGTPLDCTYECLVFDLESILSGNRVCKSDAADLLSQDRRMKSHFPGLPPADPVRAAADEAFRAMKERPEGYRFTVLGALYSFLGAVVSGGGCQLAEKPDGGRARRLARFKRVLSLIKQRYHEELTLDEMAACAGMNKKYFCRFFREMTQRTPVEFLNYYRIESACEQLVTTDRNISEIALGCGFNDISYFIRVFKKYKAVTPTQYLKSASFPTTPPEEDRQ